MRTLLLNISCALLTACAFGLTTACGLGNGESQVDDLRPILRFHDRSEKTAQTVSSPTRRPDVILITVDTLRADRLGAYGSDVATPNIDQLAADGALFEQATCPMTVTRPSHFSLFTSRYPREHGVVNNQLALPESELTMAEVLKEAGYRTGAFVGVRILGPFSGAKQGFEILVDAEATQDTADQVVGRAIDWLTQLDPREPVFLWLHLYDPHMPYAPPETFRPEAGPDVPELLTEEASWGGLSEIAVAQNGEIGSVAYQRTLDLYDGEVAWTDAQIGVLFEALAERGRWDDSLIVFTADHGECFENGYFFRHADCLSDGALRVPLILRQPDRIVAGQRIDTPVELLDLAPTIFSLTGLPTPETFGGRDLSQPIETEVVDRVTGERFALFEYPLYSKTSGKRRQGLWRRIQTVQGERMRRTRPDLRIAGVRTERFKFLATSDGREFLFDLVTDPDERRSIAAEHPDEADRLRRLLRRALREHPLTVLDEDRIDPRLLEDLKALGYL